MSNTDTASLCRVEARSCPGLRLVIAALAVVTASLMFIPAAFAQGRSPRRRGCAAAHAPIPSTSRARLQRAVVCLINQQRRMRGLPGLSENGRLNRSAQGWTNVMVNDRDFSHGADFSARISAVGFNWSTAGENIATGYLTPATVVQAWMASTGHCQNILNPDYRYVGTGVSDRSIAGHSTLAGTWTQDFGLLMGQSDASRDWGPAEGCPYT
jgi:uncharacterized protein YkwD